MWTRPDFQRPPFITVDCDGRFNDSRVDWVSRLPKKYAESKAFRGLKMTMEELLHRLNTLIEVNGYPVLWEYKAYLAGKAETHVKQVYAEY